MKKNILLFVLCACATLTHAQQSMPTSQWDPRSTEWYSSVPPKVQPGIGVRPPSDAIILFDGKDLTKWESARRVERGNRPDPAPWKIVNGEMYIVPGTGDIQSKEYFGDCQLHIEFKLPLSSEERGNSGVFLQSTYEVQIYEGENNNELYVNGMIGSLYKQKGPLTNAYTKNGEWQVYDIIWKAPVFSGDGSVASPAMATILLNGIVIHNNYPLTGHTPYRGLPEYTPHGRMPLLLQDHGAEVAFRNIWIRNL